MEDAAQILIIEDDLATRDALTLVLEMEGYRVAVAANGRTALDYLREKPPPRLILLDLVTPEMDGSQFREEQMSDPRLAAIPVVVISGVEQVCAKAHSCGAAGFIQKPIDADTLLTTVRLFVAPLKPEVLLIEDRAAVRDLLLAELRRLGFTVHQAATPEQALEAYKQHQHRIDFVVLDAALNGPGTLADLQKINPDVRCCFLNQQESGHMAEHLASLGASHVVSEASPRLAEAAQMLRHMACRG